MKGFEDSEESEDEKRVMKTGSDKRQEYVNGMMKDLKNHLKNRDFGLLISDFEKLSDEIERDTKIPGGVIFKTKEEILPNFVIRAFVKIEDEMNEVKEKKINL